MARYFVGGTEESRGVGEKNAPGREGENGVEEGAREAAQRQADRRRFPA